MMSRMLSCLLQGRRSITGITHWLPSMAKLLKLGYSNSRDTTSLSTRLDKLWSEGEGSGCVGAMRCPNFKITFQQYLWIVKYNCSRINGVQASQPKHVGISAREAILLIYLPWFFFSRANHPWQDLTRSILQAEPSSCLDHSRASRGCLQP